MQSPVLTLRDLDFRHQAQAFGVDLHFAVRHAAMVQPRIQGAQLETLPRSCLTPISEGKQHIIHEKMVSNGF